MSVLVGISVIALWPEEREPEYSGKRLSEWLEPTLNYPAANENIRAQMEPAEAAVRHIGTNALPYILRLDRLRTPPMENGPV